MTICQQSVPCPYCSSEWSKIYHSGRCPQVKAIEYFPDGSIRRIEYNKYETKS